MTLDAAGRAASLAAALADRYRIERELGGGGMSRVFVAEETALGRQVVVKVVALTVVWWRGRSAPAELTIAWTALGAGDTTRALDGLERAARAGEPVSFMVLFGLPAYDPLRGSARFAAVIRAFGADPTPFTRPAERHAAAR